MVSTGNSPIFPVHYTSKRVSERAKDALKSNGLRLERLARAKTQRVQEEHFANQSLEWSEDLKTSLSNAPTAITPILPLFSIGTSPGKASVQEMASCPGEITPLDHFVHIHGGTTSSYEERPQVMARHKSMGSQSSADLEREAMYYREVYEAELGYHQRVSGIEAKFEEEVQIVITEISIFSRHLQVLLETRRQERHKAACAMLDELNIREKPHDLEQLKI